MPTSGTPTVIRFVPFFPFSRLHLHYRSSLHTLTSFRLARSFVCFLPDCVASLRYAYKSVKTYNLSLVFSGGSFSIHFARWYGFA